MLVERYDHSQPFVKETQKNEGVSIESIKKAIKCNLYVDDYDYSFEQLFDIDYNYIKLLNDNVKDIFIDLRNTNFDGTIILDNCVYPVTITNAENCEIHIKNDSTVSCGNNCIIHCESNNKITANDYLVLYGVNDNIINCFDGCNIVVKKDNTITSTDSCNIVCSSSCEISTGDDSEINVKGSETRVICYNRCRVMGNVSTFIQAGDECMIRTGSSTQIICGDLCDIMYFQGSKQHGTDGKILHGLNCKIFK